MADVVDSLFQAVKIKNSGEFRVFNQFSETVSIKHIAQIIKNKFTKENKKIVIKHIKNPRKENEKHKMKMINKNFLKILKRKTLPIKKAIEDTLEELNFLNE